MRKTKIAVIAAVLAALALLLTGNCSYAIGPDPIPNIEKSTKAPDKSYWKGTFRGYASPGYTSKTCGGNHPGPGVQSYFFGFKRQDGFCTAREFVANNSNEAWMCARQSCSNCGTIEDITGGVRDSMLEIGNNPIYSYCPLK